MGRIESAVDTPSKHSTYNATAAGKARRATYRHETGKFTTTSAYLAKPFIAVDGNTTTVAGRTLYTELHTSDGLSIKNPAGLSTIEVFAFLSRNLPPSDKGIPIMFGGAEDWNFWVRDIPRQDLAQIYEGTFRERATPFGAFTVRWQPGKAFMLRASGKKLVTIQDISSWFQAPFTEAVNTWLGTKLGGHSSQLPIGERLRLTVELANTLRARLDRTNLRPRRWTGPGNSVVTLFRRHRIKDAMADVPGPVASASRFAYAGGRIEPALFGSVSCEPSHQYDLNSAYAEGLTHVPSLANGRWAHHKGDPGSHPFALYKVTTSGASAILPSPVFTRGPLGAISFPVHASNWVWSPEMDVIREWSDRGYGDVHIIEAWVFTPSSTVRPFAFIADLYRERQALKEADDPAQLAVKVVLAAIYGKLCQQLGFLEAKGKRPEEIPPYHQLEWAGYVTSWTRAAMFRATLPDLSAVIAFETDALFTRKPLDLPVSTELGEWKHTEYRSLTYVQSGIYAGETTEGKKVLKVRGFLTGGITHAALNRALQNPPTLRRITAKESQFVSLGIALQVPGMFAWRQWVTRDKVLRCEPVGKRIHEICDCTETETGGLQLEIWHRTVCPIRDQISREYPVQWINPDPEMTRLEALRREINEWD